MDVGVPIEVVRRYPKSIHRGKRNWHIVLPSPKMANSEIATKLEGASIMEDNLNVYPKNSIQYRVTLSRDDVRLSPLNVSRRRTSAVRQVPSSISLKDVTGCLLLQNKNQEVTTAYFCIYYYPYRRKILGRKSRKRQTLTLMVNTGQSFTENKYRAALWKTAILYTCRRIDTTGDPSKPLPPRKHHLVLLNPMSGNKKGMQTYDQYIRSMFVESEFDYEMIVTERANHARAMMRDLPLEQFDGIIIVSGDGLVHEVLNGLSSRIDWERAIRLPIGIVPVGSGNALAAAITYRAGLNDLKNYNNSIKWDELDIHEQTRIWRESYSSHFIQHCAFLLMRHVVSPMDLMLVEAANQKMVSFLSVTWGFVADVDIESEKYRKLGAMRFTVGALKRILNLKTYKGRLSFLPSEPYIHRQCRSEIPYRNGLKRSFTTSESDVITDDVPKRVTKCESLLQLAFRPRSVSQQDDENDQFPTRDLETLTPDFRDENCNINHASDLHFTTKTAGSESACRINSTLPPLDQPVPNDWITIEDDFIMVSAMSLSHLSRDIIVHPGIAWDDGLITLCIIRADITKSQLLGVMAGMEDGSHVKSSTIEFIQCHAFRLEPLTPSGCIVVDGELIEYGPLQAQIMPKCARIMTATET